MTLPIFSTHDQAANRKAWADWLRRSDWFRLPSPDGEVKEVDSPWDLGVKLAFDLWPSSQDAIDNEDYESEEAVEDAIILGCYGVRGDGGAIDREELPERLRNQILMAARAAQSALPYANDDGDINRDFVADMVHEREWNLAIIGGCLTAMWKFDPSPMRGAIMSPRDVARLVADILDAAPPSLITGSGH